MASSIRKRVFSAFCVALSFLFIAPAVADTIKVCSFNIQFLGQSARRRNSTLATIVRKYDIVVVQEVVAPPFPGKFPNGDEFKPDPEAGAFFGAMKSLGFDHWLSKEDTGTGPKIHVNSSATEWFVTFYKPDRVQPATDLPFGFLADDRSDHPDYERVPYAFAFRSADGMLDFVLISVHLKPGASGKARRRHELAAIAAWIDEKDDTGEQDFIVLGDMNIENASELPSVLPSGFVSLNDECQRL